MIRKLPVASVPPHLEGGTTGSGFVMGVGKLEPFKEPDQFNSSAVGAHTRKYKPPPEFLTSAKHSKNQ